MTCITINYNKYWPLERYEPHLTTTYQHNSDMVLVTAAAIVREGNVFTGVYQSFCSKGGGACGIPGRVSFPGGGGLRYPGAMVSGWEDVRVSRGYGIQGEMGIPYLPRRPQKRAVCILLECFLVVGDTCS